MTDGEVEFNGGLGYRTIVGPQGPEIEAFFFLERSSAHVTRIGTICGRLYKEDPALAEQWRDLMQQAAMSIITKALPNVVSVTATQIDKSPPEAGKDR